jgi:hypothetical protein
LCVSPWINGRPYRAGDVISLCAHGSKSIEWIVNDHALISGPGIYRVIGVIAREKESGFGAEVIARSRAVKIVVAARSDEQMGQHVEQLAVKLEGARNAEEKASVIRKLAYTRDRRIVPALVGWNYDGGDSALLCAAFENYLPIEARTKEMVLRAATKRGLTEILIRVLERFGCSEEQWKEVIVASLASDDETCVRAAVCAAQNHPADAHTKRLIELAEDPDSLSRRAAITALARNRTDETVQAIRGLLADADDEIREVTKVALSVGRLWTPGDVTLAANKRKSAGREGTESKWREERHSVRQVIAAAKDARNPNRWNAVFRLAERLTSEDAGAIEEYVRDSSKKSETGARSKEVKAVVELLSGSDKDVVDRVITILRIPREVHRGRAFRPEDFPEIYAEYRKEQESDWYY